MVLFFGLLFLSSKAFNCSDALHTFGVVNSTCNYISGAWDASTSADSANGTVSTWCPNCRRNMTLALDAVVLFCASNMDTAERDEILRIRYIINAACFQNLAGQYCLPALKKLAEDNAANHSAVVQHLESYALCGACELQFADAAVKLGTPDIVGVAGLVGLLCLRTEAEGFCIRKWEQANALSSANTQSIPSDSVLHLFCGQCVKLFLLRTYQIQTLTGADTSNITGAVALLDIVCVYNGRGYCVNQFLSENTTIQAAFGTCQGLTTGGVCTSSCSSAILAVKNVLGCCMFSLINVVSQGFGEETRDVIESTCGIEIPRGCGEQYISILFQLQNVEAAWLEANWDVATAAAVATLSAKVGEPPTAFNVTARSLDANGNIAISLTPQNADPQSTVTLISSNTIPNVIFAAADSAVPTTDNNNPNYTFSSTIVGSTPTPTPAGESKSSASRIAGVTSLFLLLAFL